MSEKIIDKNLLRIIKIKLSVDKLQNIEQIEDLCIQDKNLIEQKLNIDLTEITKLKGLKSISLKFFEITDEVINSLNQLKYLENIEFAMCIFKTKELLSNKLKSVIIYNCKNFEISIFDENKKLEVLQVIHSGIVDISKLNIFKNLNYLRIAYCNIINLSKISFLESLERLYLNHVKQLFDIDITKMSNLKFISLNGSNVSNKKDYMQKLYKQKENLEIEFKENDLPIE